MSRPLALALSPACGEEREDSPSRDSTASPPVAHAAALPAANCGFAPPCGESAAAHPFADAEALARNHPCYSEEAHHHFARMHLAVAPACNVQCHYCNRRYDCASESRPGVVSELLSPGDAVRKVLAVAAEIPELSVVGIAGPGDALANAAATFATLEGLRGAAPDLALCVSTNGLALPEHASRLVALGVRHVTVTVNMTDPEVGERIHPWIVLGGRKVRGREAARILSARQLEGIARLREGGVLVKVNSVVIPGVNDGHIPDVAKAVRKAGAFLVNLVPLLSAPEYGTHYARTGQRGPTTAELEALQRACEVDARVMRHCRQCRADAVDRLPEDRFAAYTLARLPASPARDAGELRAERRALVERARTIAARERDGALRRVAHLPADLSARIAVATRGGGLVDAHFGHARELLVYDVRRTGARLAARRKVDRYCAGGDGEGRALDGFLRALGDCQAVLVARIGRCPAASLAAAGIEAVAEHAFRPIEAAALSWFRGWAERVARAEQGAASTRGTAANVA